MLDTGTLERSRSEWAAPIVLVKKKEGSLRLRVDYRQMNFITQMDAYPMPRIDDLIDRLGKAKYITTLDLTRGYWQVPVAEEDQHKTASATPFGLFQFRVIHALWALWSSNDLPTNEGLSHRRTGGLHNSLSR